MLKLTHDAGLTCTSACCERDKLTSTHTIEQLVHALVWVVNGLPVLVIIQALEVLEVHDTCRCVRRCVPPPLDKLFGLAVLEILVGILCLQLDDAALVRLEDGRNLCGCCIAMLVIVEAHNDVVELVEPLELCLDILDCRLCAVTDGHDRPLAAHHLIGRHCVQLTFGDCDILAAITKLVLSKQPCLWQSAFGVEVFGLDMTNLVRHVLPIHIVVWVYLLVTCDSDAVCLRCFERDATVFDGRELPLTQWCIHRMHLSFFDADKIVRAFCCRVCLTHKAIA